MGLGQYTWWNNPFPDDPYGHEPECTACDDAGCPECCELVPITLDDLEEIEAQMAASKS